MEDMRSAKESRGIILMYHRVTEGGRAQGAASVSSQHFAEQLVFLRRNFDLVPLEELLLRLQERKLARQYVVLTFDDGYNDNYAVAGPILARFDAPASVFVTTGYLDQRREYWWDELHRLVMEAPENPPEWRFDAGGKEFSFPGSRPRAEARESLHALLVTSTAEDRERALDQLAQLTGASRIIRPEYRPMTSEECRLFDRGGLIRLGAHTVNHLWLAAHPIQVQEAELRNAKAALESVLGRKVDSFAYPYGKRDAVGAETLRLVREAGYSLACANVRGQVFSDNDPLWLPRRAPHDIGGDEFERRIRVMFDDFSILRGPQGRIESTAAAVAGQPLKKNWRTGTLAGRLALKAGRSLRRRFGLKNRPR